jgi:hypothetical protein
VFVCLVPPSLITHFFQSQSGAGFAGGIVSAAVDGLCVAERIKNKFLGAGESESSGDSKTSTFSVGFDY